MFDFLRNLTKSAEEKRQETVAAYLDGGLKASEQQRFEQDLAQDAALRTEVEQLRLIKESLRQLPQREVPRNFILDPAQYGRPARQPWVQAYPVLRTATALAAFFFIFALAASIFTNFGMQAAPAAVPAADVAQVEQTVDEAQSIPAEDVATYGFRENEEGTEEGAVNLANEDVADEAIEEDGADDSALETEMDSFAAEAEEAEEEMMEEAEAEAAPTALAPQMTEASTNDAATAEETTMDEDTTLQPEATAAVQPTPTISTLPRVTPPTPFPDRELELETGEAGEDLNFETANVPETEVLEADESQGAQLSASEAQRLEMPEPINTLFWVQVGLGVLLLVLAALTFYARRQR